MPRRKKTTATEDPRPATLAEAEQDLDIAEDFAARQRLNEEGREELAEKLREHHSLSPEIAAGDVDAAWELGRMSGEETFTGHAPTPDQDRVDDLGSAAGLTYKDDEPLGYDKVARRDERRWELDPRSNGEEDEAAGEDEDEKDDDGNGPLRFWDLADDLDAEVDEEEPDDDEDEDDEEDDEEEEADPLTLAEDELEAVSEEADEEDEEDVDSDLDQDDLEDDLDEDLEELDALEEDDDDLDDD